jgi:RND family efflux transporter MFP subunit
MERPTINRSEEQGMSPEGSRLGHADSAGRSGPPAKAGLLLLLLVALLGLAGVIIFGAMPRISQQTSLQEHTKEQLTKAPSVSAVIALPGAPIQEFILPGSTEAIQDAPIYARVNGYLNKRYVNIGDIVHSGQVLADIDTPELDQQVLAAVSAEEQAKANLDNTREALDKSQADLRTAAANVRKSKTDLQFFARELTRYKELVQQGAVSMEDMDSRVQAYNGGIATVDATTAAERSAQASVNSARAAVHVAQAAMNAAAAQKKQYQATQSFKKVTALFDGVVTRRNVDAGALISSGSGQGNSLLFEIAKTDVLRVFVYVPEQYVPYIHEGQKAILQFQEYPNRDFIATVSNVSGGIDPASRTLQVEIHVPNPKNLLLPGMYAQVRFQCPAKIRPPIVPDTTLQTRADGNFMYTIDVQSKVHVHKVEIGRDLGGQFEIASGLAVGDKVIVSPSDMLHDGMLVTPVIQPFSIKGEEKGSK